MLTEQDIARALPSTLKVSVSQELVDMVNNLSTDPEAAQNIRDNFVSYTSVLRDGRFKIEDFVHAVGYVSFKLMGYSNQESYVRTFPVRYQNLVGRGATAKDISAYVSAYNKNKLVNLILEQSLVPSWVLNQDAYQAAINKQVFLMANAKREDVQQKAADSLLTHLTKPEGKGIQLNLNIPETSGLSDLKDQLSKMAEMQKNLIEAGMKTRDIAHQSIVEAEIVSDP